MTPLVQAVTPSTESSPCSQATCPGQAGLWQPSKVKCQNTRHTGTGIFNVLNFKLLSLILWVNNKLAFDFQERKSFLQSVAEGISLFILSARSNYINVTGHFSSACRVLLSVLLRVEVDCLAGRTGLPRTPVVEEYVYPACTRSRLRPYELYFRLRQDLPDKCSSHL